LLGAGPRSTVRGSVEPALAAGMDVVCDRYLLSSLAYQGEEAERDWVAQLARDGRPGDLTLRLDLPVAVAAPRRRAAGRTEERYDADAVQERVAAAYRALVAGDPKAVTIDASAPIDDVTGAITAVVDRLLYPVLLVERSAVVCAELSAGGSGPSRVPNLLVRLLALRLLGGVL